MENHEWFWQRRYLLKTSFWTSVYWTGQYFNTSGKKIIQREGFMFTKSKGQKKEIT